MALLVGHRCVAFRADSPHVTDEEVAELHPHVPDWDLVEENGVRKLRRLFRFPDFASALGFTVAVGEEAEAEGHHPLLLTDWGKVTVTWWTHKIKDLHRNDFIMAAKTEQIWQQWASV